MVQGKLYGTVELPTVDRRNCFSLVRSRKYGAWVGPRGMAKLVFTFSKPLGREQLACQGCRKSSLSVLKSPEGELLPYGGYSAAFCMGSFDARLRNLTFTLQTVLVFFPQSVLYSPPKSHHLKGLLKFKFPIITSD